MVAGGYRRRVAPGSPRKFHLKDVFTLVNLLSGVVGVHYVVANQLRRAGYAVLVGYLGGDLPDGAVARLTGTGNRFGAEFDSIVDHFVHVVVPGLIVYSAYRQGGHELVGLFLMGTLVATATIRHARLAAERFDFPLCWCGLPRTISGLPDSIETGYATTIQRHFSIISAQVMRVKMAARPIA